SGAELAVQSGYYILLILGDYRDSTQTKYYALQLIKVPEVSLISTSPISVVATPDKAPTNQLIGLPLSGSDNVLNIGVFYDVTKYVTPLVYDDSTSPSVSSAATSCISN